MAISDAERARLDRSSAGLADGSSSTSSGFGGGGNNSSSSGGSNRRNSSCSRSLKQRHFSNVISAGAAGSTTTAAAAATTGSGSGVAMEYNWPHDPIATDTNLAEIDFEDFRNEDLVYAFSCGVRSLRKLHNR